MLPLMDLSPPSKALMVLPCLVSLVHLMCSFIKRYANIPIVKDGVPRDCATPKCGSEMDTTIIRQQELGTNKASALGRTKGSGPVDAASAIATFLGGSNSSTSTSANSPSTSQTNNNNNNKARGLLSNHAGRATGKGQGSGSTSQGTKTPPGTIENGVSKAAGTGAKSGLPTCSDEGLINMTFHQVNQDGAGPLTAAIDATSGGQDPSAFKSAQVTMNVPGIGVGGLSAATITDFPVQVQMPAGMMCSGSVGGASNVCIVRLQNSALAGPFGGSAAFTMSPGAKKRAIEYNLRKRHMARGLLGKLEEQ